jgi:hypothetical protein
VSRAIQNMLAVFQTLTLSLQAELKGLVSLHYGPCIYRQSIIGCHYEGSVKITIHISSVKIQSRELCEVIRYKTLEYKELQVCYSCIKVPVFNLLDAPLKEWRGGGGSEGGIEEVCLFLRNVHFYCLRLRLWAGRSRF